MRKLWPIALLLTGFLTESALLAQAPVPLTRNSARAMTPETLSRRLFGDVSEILFPILYSGRAVDRLELPLQRLDFLSRPYATEEAGICGTTQVTVTFESVGRLRGARTLVRPRHIFSEPNYFLIDRPRVLRSEPVTDAERPQLNTLCAAQDPRTLPFFNAPSFSDAAQAARLLAELVDAAQSARANAPLNCSAMSAADHVPISGIQCLQDIAHLDPTKIWRVTQCVSPRNCLRVIVDTGIAVSFELQPGERAPARITLEPNIVVTSIDYRH